MPRPPTFDHLRKKQPLELRIPVYLEQEPVERLTKLQEDLEAARAHDRVVAEQMRQSTNTPVDLAPSQEVTRLVAEVDGAETAVRESTVTVVIRQIGRKRYDALIDAHPPTDDEKAEAVKAGLEPPPYNAETFAPALISASCAEPLMTVEQVQELFDEWSTGEINELFAAALAVNTGRRTVDLGKG